MNYVVEVYVDGPQAARTLVVQLTCAKKPTQESFDLVLEKLACIDADEEKGWVSFYDEPVTEWRRRQMKLVPKSKEGG